MKVINIFFIIALFFEPHDTWAKSSNKKNLSYRSIKPVFQCNTQRSSPLKVDDTLQLSIRIPLIISKQLKEKYGNTDQIKIYFDPNIDKKGLGALFPWRLDRHQVSKKYCSITVDVSSLKTINNNKNLIDSYIIKPTSTGCIMDLGKPSSGIIWGKAVPGACGADEVKLIDFECHNDKKFLNTDDVQELFSNDSIVKVTKGCRTIRQPKPAAPVVQEICAKCILEKIMPLSPEQNKLLEGIAKSQMDSEERRQIIDERLKSNINDPEAIQLIRNDREQRREREKKLDEEADKTADAPPTKQELEKMKQEEELWANLPPECKQEPPTPPALSSVRQRVSEHPKVQELGLKIQELHTVQPFSLEEMALLKEQEKLIADLMESEEKSMSNDQIRDYDQAEQAYSKDMKAYYERCIANRMPNATPSQ